MGSNYSGASSSSICTEHLVLTLFHMLRKAVPGCGGANWRVNFVDILAMSAYAPEYKGGGGEPPSEGGPSLCALVV
eukprot:6203833-Pleurochrysis_carterae.AAC.5